MTKLHITFDFYSWKEENESCVEIWVSELNAQVLSDPDAQPYEYAIKELKKALTAMAILESNDRNAELSRIAEIVEVNI